MILSVLFSPLEKAEERQLRDVRATERYLHAAAHQTRGLDAGSLTLLQHCF